MDGTPEPSSVFSTRGTARQHHRDDDVPGLQQDGIVQRIVNMGNHCQGRHVAADQVVG